MVNKIPSSTPASVSIGLCPNFSFSLLFVSLFNIFAWLPLSYLIPIESYIVINEKGGTSINSIYAGGDVAPLGPSTAINAMGAGKRAAKAIIEALA